MEVFQNSQKFRADKKINCTRTPGILARGVQNSQNLPGTPTKLTEV